MKTSDRNNKLKPAPPRKRILEERGIDINSSEKERGIYLSINSTGANSFTTSIRELYSRVVFSTKRITIVLIADFDYNKKQVIKTVKKSVKKRYHNTISNFKKAFNYIDLIGSKIAEKRNIILIFLLVLTPIAYTYLSEKITLVFIPLVAGIIASFKERSNILIPILLATSIFLGCNALESLESFRHLKGVFLVNSLITISYLMVKQITTQVKNRENLPERLY